MKISHSKAQFWKSMKNFSPSEQIEKIVFSRDSAFPGQEIIFQPFTVICGLHGSGKSSLLGYVAESLFRGVMHPDMPPFYKVSKNREGRPALKGSCQVSFRRDGREVIYVTEPGSSAGGVGSPPEVIDAVGEVYPRVLNPDVISSEIGMFFQNYPIKNLEEDSKASEIQTRKDLEALRDILGVSYDEVIYTPTVSDPPYTVEWPYVRARRGDTWIDSHSMSYGELCVHYIRWAVKNPLGGPIILDEPEANIAPRGHAALIDEIARLARSSGTQVILATHSASFLDRVPLDWVVMCVRSGLGPVLIKPSRPSDLRDTLGIENPLRSIILVEDKVAKAVLGFILSAHNFPMYENVEILEAGSWGNAVRTSEVLSRSKRITAVAVLDGDQADQTSGKINVFCLPGEGPPEKVFFERASLFIPQVAAGLGCSEASVHVFFAEIDALEHHRWLEILSRRTGQDWNYCLRVAFDIWHHEPANKRECERLVRGIEGALFD